MKRRDFLKGATAIAASPALTVTKVEDSKKEDKKGECEHINWCVELDCRVGNAFCYDCGSEISLVTAINNMQKRFQAVIDKYEKDKK